MRKSIIGAVATFALTTSTLFAGTAVAAPAEPGPGEVLGAPAAVAPSATPRLAQWQDLQFGLFMHWGVYSAFAGSYNGKVQGIGYPEQIKAWMNISDDAYLAEAAKMDAAKWDAAAVCQTAQDTGMKYVMITSKHHDGFAMWDTKTTDYNIVKKTAFGRDPMKELQTECNKRGIKLAFYYSIIDWTKQVPEPYGNRNPVDAELMDLMHRQITELLTNYGPIAEFWFDMGKPTAEQSEQLAQWVHDVQPDTVVNSRVWNNKGDFEVGGDNAVSSNFSYGPWESIKSIFPACWGYCADRRANRSPGSEQHKARAAVNDLVTVISGGGQFAYNIGPKGDGSFDPYDAEVLKQIGDWMKRHPDAVTGAKATYFPIQDAMRVTTKGNYLFFFPREWSEGQRLTLPGLANKVTSVKIDGTDQELPFERNGFDLTVTLKGESPDALKSVIRVELDGPAGMYTDKTVTLANGLGAVTSDKVTGLRGTNTWGNGTALDTYVVDKGDTLFKEVSLKFTFGTQPTPRTKYKITFGENTFVVTGSQLMAGPVGEGLTLKPKTVTRLRVELAEPRYYTDNVDFSIRSVEVEAVEEPGAQIAPTITEQPVPVSVVKGTSATFSVTAVGRPAPSYQWYKKAPGDPEPIAIENATESVLTLKNVTLEDNGMLFSVKVTNDAGTVRSQEAALTVTEASKNLALRKPATQSSTGWGGNASRAVDGNTNGFWDNDSVTHTQENSQGSWWQVNLEGTYAIGKVNVWNRAAEQTCRPTCDQRLSDFYVIVSKENLGRSVNIEALKTREDVKVIKVDGVGKYPSTVDFEGFEGTFVRVFLPSSNPLSLAEVEVAEAEKKDTAPDVSSIEVTSLLDTFEMAGDGQFRTVTAEEGATLKLHASATGEPNPSVQWQRRDNLDSEWADMEGENEPSIDVTITEEDNGAQYRLKATNRAGEAYSGTVELRMKQEEQPPQPDTPQSTPDAPQSTPDAPQSTPDAPQSTPDAPQSTPDTPQSTPDVPQSTPDTPQSTPDTPQSTPSEPGSDNPQSGGDTTPAGILKINQEESKAVQGGTLVINASGLPANTDVLFTIHSTPTVIGTYRTDDAGKVTVRWAIPANFPAGAHTVFATVGTTVVKVPVEIAKAPTQGSIVPPGNNTTPQGKPTPNTTPTGKIVPKTGKLASTGATAGTLALAGILTVAGGIGMMRTRRRH